MNGGREAVCRWAMACMTPCHRQVWHHACGWALTHACRCISPALLLSSPPPGYDDGGVVVMGGREAACRYMRSLSFVLDVAGGLPYAALPFAFLRSKATTQYLVEGGRGGGGVGEGRGRKGQKGRGGGKGECGRDAVRGLVCVLSEVGRQGHPIARYPLHSSELALPVTVCAPPPTLLSYHYIPSTPSTLSAPDPPDPQVRLPQLLVLLSLARGVRYVRKWQVCVCVCWGGGSGGRGARARNCCPASFCLRTCVSAHVCVCGRVCLCTLSNA